MGKKVIGLLGSPLSEGNTAKLLDRALKGAEDAGCTVEKIVVVNLDFQACMEMMFCTDHDTCIIDDDLQQLYPKFKEMDHLNPCHPGYDNGNSRQTQISDGSFSGFFHGKVRTEKTVHIRRKKKGAKRVVYLHLRYEYSGSVCRREDDSQGVF